MGEGPGTPGSPIGAQPSDVAQRRDVEEIRDDIERTRAELGDTVAELVEKANVKARVKARVAVARDRAPAVLRAQGAQLARRATAKPAVPAIVVPLAGLLVWRRRRRRR